MGALRDELDELLGPGGLAALAQVRGGRRAYVPKRVPHGHWIERALGRERAGALAWRYGGCRIDIPLGPPPAQRNAWIRARRAAGDSIAAIAAEADLSERQVRNILR